MVTMTSACYFVQSYYCSFTVLFIVTVIPNCTILFKKHASHWCTAASLMPRVPLWEHKNYIKMVKVPCRV